VARRDPDAPSDVDQPAVDRLVGRASAVLGREQVRTAFSGTRGLSPTAVATVSAAPATVIVIIALVLGQPVLLVLAAVAMAGTMVVVMTRVNETRVVAQVRTGLVVLGSRRGDLFEVARVVEPPEIEPGGGQAWCRVRVGDERLWVSRPAFGGVVERLTPDPDEGA
jgi:hypothetical protein